MARYECPYFIWWLYSEFILSLVPTVFQRIQGNPLVFFTPTLLEVGVTDVAVIIGALVSVGIISRRRERI